MSPDPFAVLGLTPNATEAAADRAYERLRKTHHPEAGGDPAKWDEIEAAYDQAVEECRRRKQPGVVRPRTYVAIKKSVRRSALLA